MAGTILLSGGTGMVGRNVLDLARERSLEIIAPGRAELDLLDAEGVRRKISETRPDIIIHTAGRVGGIEANMRAPVAFLLENFDMGRNLVMAAHEAGVPRFINLGSSCMYPKDVERPLREDDILGGPLEPTNEAYAIAKLAVVRLCQYLNAEAPDRAYRTLIPCNLYGRYDSFDPARSHLAAAAIRKLDAAKANGTQEVEIWGDGTVRREFLYAGDLADAILQAVDQYDTLPPIMNIGAGIDHSVNAYYEAVASAVGYAGGFAHKLDRPVGMRQKLMDVSLAAKWGWTAKTPLAEGLSKTYAWYKDDRWI